ncbi:ABC transporter substrate-binding protein [Oryzihumus sp.]|uniref:ABC transporter substrate-binding protein n=1 Tax=Oryzihumus sp. TaxID=1968903 RepID=UPI002ED84A27
MRAVRAVGLAATACVMLAVSACGAGAGGGSSDSRTLHVLVGANAQHAAAMTAWQKRIGQQFHQATGGDLSFDTFASASEEQTKIQTSVVSGTGPDVYQIGTTFTPVAYSSRAFATLTDRDWATIGGRDRFFGPQLAMAGPDAKHQIGVPFVMRPYAMVYNTALFAKAGITSPPKTWDELVADARKLNDPGSGTWGTAIGYADDYDPWKYIWTNTLQSGGRLVSDDLTKAQLTSRPVADSFAAYFGLLTSDHVVNPKAVTWKASDALAAFANGQVGILPMVTPGAEPTLRAGKVHGSYRFAPMPTIPFGHSSSPSGAQPVGTIVSGDNLAIAGYTKHKDLALTYVKLVTDPENQLFYNQTFGDLPANQQAASGLAAKDPQTAAFLQAERAAHPTPFTGAWAQVQLALANVVVQSQPDLASGHVDPAATAAKLAAAQNTVQQALDRQRR